jgi:NAD(P)-dependent dehydrogenase (short-subunit alcohol dehydrogenase family)
MAQYREYGIEGRTAIVTGGGGGMGAATAVELAKAGARVAIFGRRPGPIEETANECNKYTPGAFALSVDVGDKDAVLSGVARVLEAYGTIDILINNAGFEMRHAPGESFFDDYFDKLSPDEYLSFYRTHALGHYLMCNAVIPNMVKNKYGRIVNVTSVLALNGIYETPAYTGSKAAATTQTKGFAFKYGKDNITVNAILPGMVDTPMKIDSPPEEYEIVRSMTPLRRICKPIDVARVILFFAQENLFITGEAIVVDGGSSIP